MRKLENLRSEISEWETLEKSLRDIAELAGLGDLRESDVQNFHRELLAAEKKIDELEFKTLLGGEYDSHHALLTVRSGAGGVDAQDWAEMLLRMYLRYAEKKNFVTEVIDEARGNEAGIKSATIEIRGSYAYGYLRGEAGIHRLVRLSPFNANSLRQTSFASVEVLPVVEEGSTDIILKPEELRVDTYRSGGAGGQNVNKTETAVRVTHLPTNTVVTCQSERSQLQNREEALKLLRGKLLLKQIEEKEAEKKRLKGEHKSAEWGNQIRSYVLHPYTMVKDHRTDAETSDAAGTLEGGLDIFIQSTLQWMKKEK